MPNDVDAWFETEDPAQKVPMQRVREIILGTDSRISETIKWQTPTFMFEGNICSFNPAKHFVSLLFHRGAEIPGIHPSLEGDGKLARTLRFADLPAVETGAEDLRAVIRAWITSKEK